jgi:hypothetical protein
MSRLQHQRWLLVGRPPPEAKVKHAAYRTQPGDPLLPRHFDSLHKTAIVAEVATCL